MRQEPLVSHPSAAPTRKVGTGAGTAGAVAALLLPLARSLEIDLEPASAMALGGLIVGACQAITSYLVRDRAPSRLPR